MSHTSPDINYNIDYITKRVGGNNGLSEFNKNYVNNQSRVIRDQDSKLLPYLRSKNNYNQRINNNGHSGNNNNNFIKNGKKIFETNSCNSGCNDITNINQNYQNNNNAGSPSVIRNFEELYTKNPHEKSKKNYDPYLGYLFNEGLLNDLTQIRRYRTEYLNIDSNYRDKKPSVNIDNFITLPNNPLQFTEGSSQMFINHVGHELEINDAITLDGAVSKYVTLSTFISQNNPTIEIPAGSRVMKIKYKHGIPLSYTSESVQVEIKNISGDRGAIEVTSYLGNIPINTINTSHNAIINLDQRTIDDSGLTGSFSDRSEDYFFIILPRRMRNPSNEAPFTLRNYNFNLKFLSLSGIPLNKINAKYPVNPENVKGFHTIVSTFPNGYFIDTNVVAVSDLLAGGNCIQIGKITKVNPGYPNPNSYTIDLGRVYHNIVNARLISTEIPNSEKMIRNEPEERKNNKIYWNNIDDGEHLYSIEVPNGNYSVAELVNVIQTLFSGTQRVTSGSDIGSVNTGTHFVRVNINENTDEVTFSPFKESIMSQPIIDVNPDIPLNSTSTINPSINYIITINHQQHGMSSQGDTILIQDAISHNGIPSNVINGEHIVSEIVDENNYRITLPRFNVLSDRSETKGGANVKIFIPDKMRLLFDKDDTIGSVLGFRNPGEPSSITPFGTKISNKSLYEFDTTSDVLGNKINIENNSIKMSGENYIVMIVNPLNQIESVSPVSKFFSKIILCDSPGNILFNTFVPTINHYEDPLHEVFQLDIEFRAPDGSLFDFNGCDHSFTLEFTVVADIPEGTGINANTGKNYNQKIDYY